MVPIEDLPTPAVLVDVDVVSRNLGRMAQAARSAGVRLRPHAKTHKVPQVGRMQIAAGAAGLALAKTSEAEVFAAAGFDDIFLAYPVVGKGKPERLLALSEKIRLAVGVDSLDGARALAAPFAAAGRRIEVLLKVDLGTRRVGVFPEAAPAMALRLGEIPGIALRGLFAHAGHAYGENTRTAVEAVGRNEGETLAEVARAVRSAGAPVAEVSVGSTPTARSAMAAAGVTECRPGNFVYHDASQVSLGTCSLEDCALTVIATVVSVPDSSRAVIDAGSKTLSSDPLRPTPGGHGFILGRASRVTRLSEEHGVIETAPGETFTVGERVRVLPNHACVVSNLHDRIHAVREGRVVEVWRVAARGMVE
ncbi:MAG TPA: alanine racemase [Thermoanaerobaculia bacterium]|nr:alanine racemase [Thermoanaerobaculia bacterium]